MPITQYTAYRRWLDKWTPHIVYGAQAAGASPAHAASVGEPLALDELPGGHVVVAD